VQEQAFFSSLLDCTVFAHQRVDFPYLESKEVLAGVATKLENLGLNPFLEHRCDWNDTLIRQFYATYEMDFDEETIKWMTGKREFEATLLSLQLKITLIMNISVLVSMSMMMISLKALLHFRNN
jgi:hypothetical protein